jgi:hypothetical protein
MWDLKLLIDLELNKLTLNSGSFNPSKEYGKIRAQEKVTGEFFNSSPNKSQVPMSPTLSDQNGYWIDDRPLSEPEYIKPPSNNIADPNVANGANSMQFYQPMVSQPYPNNNMYMQPQQNVYMGGGYNMYSGGGYYQQPAHPHPPPGLVKQPNSGFTMQNCQPMYPQNTPAPAPTPSSNTLAPNAKPLKAKRKVRKVKSTNEKIHANRSPSQISNLQLRAGPQSPR